MLCTSSRATCACLFRGGGEALTEEGHCDVPEGITDVPRGHGAPAVWESRFVAAGEA